MDLTKTLFSTHDYWWRDSPTSPIIGDAGGKLTHNQYKPCGSAGELRVCEVNVLTRRTAWFPANQVFRWLILSPVLIGDVIGCATNHWWRWGEKFIFTDSQTLQKCGTTQGLWRNYFTRRKMWFPAKRVSHSWFTLHTYWWHDIVENQYFLKLFKIFKKYLKFLNVWKFQRNTTN